jgi:hypothetical protein
VRCSLEQRNVWRRGTRRGNSAVTASAASQGRTVTSRLARLACPRCSDTPCRFPLGPISYPRQHALPALSADPVLCYLLKADTAQQASPLVGHGGRLRMLSTFKRRGVIS